MLLLFIMKVSVHLCFRFYYSDSITRITLVSNLRAPFPHSFSIPRFVLRLIIAGSSVYSNQNTTLSMIDQPRCSLWRCVVMLFHFFPSSLLLPSRLYYTTTTDDGAGLPRC